MIAGCSFLRRAALHTDSKVGDLPVTFIIIFIWCEGCIDARWYFTSSVFPTTAHSVIQENKADVFM
jgi:hypothetical protein